MSRPNFTDITIILDASGSMLPLIPHTCEALNTFIQNQKELPGEVCFSLVAFNDSCWKVYTQQPAAETKPLTAKNHWCSGGTALVDTVCHVIDQTGKRLADLPEIHRPSKVLVAIVTDGEENSSTRHTRDDLHQRIAHQRDVYQWQFVFLGANQDAIGEAGKYGIAAGNALNFQTTASGMRTMSANISNSTRSYRLSGSRTTDNYFG